MTKVLVSGCIGNYAAIEARCKEQGIDLVWTPSSECQFLVKGYKSPQWKEEKARQLNIKSVRLESFLEFISYKELTN